MPEIGGPHKLTHQDGGNDEISLEGLAGDLADAQESTWARVSGKPTTFTPANHATAHENAGADEIGVAGLSGLLGDSQTPLTHKTSHQDGGADEISVAGLAGRQIFVPYNGKIADITGNPDWNKFTIGLATPLSETRKIILVILSCVRISGTGTLYSYPNEGSRLMELFPYGPESIVVIKDGTQRVQLAQDTATDDFDLYCMGYVVETT